MNDVLFAGTARSSLSTSARGELSRILTDVKVLHERVPGLGLGSVVDHIESIQGRVNHVPGQSRISFSDENREQVATERPIVAEVAA